MMIADKERANGVMVMIDRLLGIDPRAGGCQSVTKIIKGKSPSEGPLFHIDPGYFSKKLDSSCQEVQKPEKLSCVLKRRSRLSCIKILPGHFMRLYGIGKKKVPAVTRALIAWRGCVSLLTLNPGEKQ